MNIKHFFTHITKNWPAKIICLVIAVFLSEFYRGTLLGKRYIVVPLSLENRGPLVPAEQYPRKVKIMIWGENSSIASIDDDDVIAFVDISDFKTGGTYRVPIQTKLSSGVNALDTLEISAEPATLSLTLAERIRKEVPVLLSLKGIPADGYEVSESGIEPPALEIEGPAAVIQKLDVLLTEPLSIESRTNGFSGTVSIINSEPLVSVLGKTQVQYTVKINETITQKRFDNIPLYFEKSSRIFSITTDQKTGSVEIQGPKKLLERWTVPENILTVSYESITEPGTYTLPVIPVVSAGNSKMTVLNFSPKSVEITAVPPEIKTED